MAEIYRELPIYERAPDYHLLSPESAAIIEALTDGSLEARAAIFDMVDQFWVSTATWGLDLWEQLVGIDTDYTLPLDARRAAVVAKMLGSGTCNTAMIRSIVRSITGYDSKIIENFADYSFSVVFVGEKAGFIDVDRDAIIAAVEIVKPSHLQFIIEGITWRDLHNSGYTWAGLESELMTWHDLETKVMVQKKE